ncbi:Pseudouridine kinase [Slackia heliotrinireducens]|uniref:Sugar kinase, ribokinase n=1 Tax=Slackia heliotrinireducens (strain ATCC 29202 / DSM 20476 / NCTC 11029 / RHS 1) TaxID=471855 RepID=C7N782_SLAHD|nr:PfkB family carbohydrate kinase [Slackia heliotrinireducens]ACV22767.1 sugar kinase, ribokinase [Slackia heliotrinireducens DSM 20476]VEH01438.1 Pseudouridine kinase [Slackia heliotrinireducens]
MGHTVVIGTTFVDVKGVPKGAYDPQGRNVGDVKIVHGGVGRNVAENFANVGKPVSFVGTMEDSAFGRDVRRRLLERGVNLDHAPQASDNGIGMWLVILDENGDLAGSISKMPELDLLEEHLSREIDTIAAGADAIVLELDLNERIAEVVVDAAKRHGKPLYAIVGNMSVVLSRKDLVKQTDCFICNVIEAAKYFGLGALADYSPTQMLEFLPDAASREGIASMVVTMGAEGAVYFDGRAGSAGICPPYPAKMVDSTGAGDAFFSGTVMKLVEGCVLADAVAFGARLASATIGSEEATCPVGGGF